MRRIAVSLLLLSLFVTPALAKLEAPAWTELEQRFRKLFAQAGEGDKKLEAVKQVAGDGETRAWNLLADGLLLEATHLTKIAEALNKDLEKLQGLLGTKAHSDVEWEQIYGLQTRVSEQEKARAESDATVKAIVAAYTDAGEEGRKFVLAKARGAKEWAARAAAARVAALAPDEASAKQTIAESLAKDADPRIKVAALDALQKAPGTAWQDPVVSRIEDADWGVQLMAIRIAGDREVGKAIPVLIKALSTASPRVSEEIGVALHRLTGQSIEPYAEPWAKWWESNRAKWGADGRPLQPLVNSPRQSDIDAYGIKVKSDKILFIIDVSGSMKEEKKGAQTTPTPKPHGPVTGEGPPKPVEEPPQAFSGPKIEWAKRELRRALKNLPKEAMFDIIAFNHAVQQWQPKMMPATDANKELAQAWFRDVPPAGSTYVDGALRLAFKMAGMGAYDKAYPGVGVDTILLLSDGAPTDNSFPESKNMEPNEILAHVAEWNSQKRIRINCVGIDNVVVGIEFLKKLAAQNGGTYVDG